MKVFGVQRGQFFFNSVGIWGGWSMQPVFSKKVRREAHQKGQVPGRATPCYRHLTLGGGKQRTRGCADSSSTQSWFSKRCGYLHQYQRHEMPKPWVLLSTWISSGVCQPPPRTIPTTSQEPHCTQISTSIPSGRDSIRPQRQCCPICEDLSMDS